VHQLGDGAAAAAHRLSHQVPPGGGERHPRRTAIVVSGVARGQSFPDEPVAHPGRRRRRDPQFLCQVHGALRAAHHQYDEGPELWQGDVLIQRGQRSRGQRDEDAARRQQGVHHLLLRGVEPDG
jgi:hypothetical protein